MTALEELLATIRRLPLPERLQLIKRASLEAAEDSPKPPAVAEGTGRHTVDEFLAARLTPPSGVGPVNLEDMDRAIAEGALRPGNGGGASLLGLMSDEPELVDQVCSIAYEARHAAHFRAVDE